MAKVKGVLVTAMRAYLIHHYGGPAVEDAIHELSPEDSALLQRRFLDGSMYPTETMVALRRAMRILVLANKDGPGAPSEVGNYIAEHVFKGPFKPILANDPVTMVQKITWVKNFFYEDYDRTEATLLGNNSCRIVYQYENGIRPARSVCLTLGSFWARTLELTGAPAVAINHAVCICDGADRCEFTLSW